jgi:hypothetical protein
MRDRVAAQASRIAALETVPPGATGLEAAMLEAVESAPAIGVVWEGVSPAAVRMQAAIAVFRAAAVVDVLPFYRRPDTRDDLRSAHDGSVQQIQRTGPDV